MPWNLRGKPLYGLLIVGLICFLDAVVVPHDLLPTAIVITAFVLGYVFARID